MAESVLSPQELSEILRLLGAESGADGALRSEIDGCLTELRGCDARGLFKIFEIKTNDAEVEISPSLRLAGADLARLCRGCGRAALLAVTLGAGADRLIARAQAQSISRAVVMDACASAEVERMCCEMEPRIMEAAGADKFLTMRFSPGYGDVPQSESAKIIEALDAARRIGLTVTRSQMLVPVKSVTAVIGIADAPQKRYESCGLCAAAASCPYKKRGAYCGERAKYDR